MYEEITKALHRKMCGGCLRKQFCHPSPNSLNLVGIMTCLQHPQTTVLPNHPQELGSQSFPYKDLLGRELHDERLEAALIGDTVATLNEHGSQIDPSATDWAATISVATSCYIVRIWDREVTFTCK